MSIPVSIRDRITISVAFIDENAPYAIFGVSFEFEDGTSFEFEDGITKEFES